MPHLQRQDSAARRVKKRNQRGYLLVETFVALAIVGTGIAAAVTALSTSSISTASAREKATASWVASSQIELIKASPYGTTIDAYPTVSPPAGYSLQYTIAPLPGGEDFNYIQDVTIEVFRDTELITSVDIVKFNQ